MAAIEAERFLENEAHVGNKVSDPLVAVFTVMLRSTFLYLAQQKKFERCLLTLPGAQRLASQFVA